MTSDISAYTVQGYIHKLETLNRYEYPFERLKRLRDQQKEDEKESAEEAKIEEEEKKKL